MEEILLKILEWLLAGGLGSAILWLTSGRVRRAETKQREQTAYEQLRVGKDKEGQIAAEASVIRMEGSTHKEIGLVLAQTAEKTEDQSCGQSTQVEVKHTATEENSPVKNRGKPKAWHLYVLLALLGIVVLWYGGLKTVGRALKR